MACKCKRKRIGSSKGRSVAISQEDILWGVAGAATGLIANKFLAMAKDKLPQGVLKDNLGKVVPIAKAAGGGYMAYKNDLARNWRFFGLGLAGTGVNELGQKLAPEYFVSVGNIESDMYKLIGNSELIEIPVNPSEEIVTDPPPFEEEVVMGTDEYLVL